MTQTAYSTTTKTFHWLTALLIISLFPLGIMGTRLPTTTDAEIQTITFVFSIHKTLGVAVFLVALARIAYALTQTKPAGLHPDRKAETLLAEIVHWMLYISLVLVPLTGWVHHSAAAFGAPIWIPFTQSLPFVPTDPTVSDLFGGLHWIWTKVMMISILLQVAGALKHHVIDKDSTLRRMWFGHTGTSEASTHSNRLPAIIAAGIFAITAGIASVMGMLRHDSTTAPTLTSVASEWSVQDGQIGITVKQLGNDVSGEFGDWTSAIVFDETAQAVAGTVETTINIGSLTLGTVTAQAMGADFFDQRNSPTPYSQPI